VKKKVQMYMWSKDIFSSSIIQWWAIKVCALSQFTLHSTRDWSLDIHKEIIVVLNLHKLLFFCISVSILHFNFNFSLEIQSQVYGKKQVFIISQPWGICLVYLEDPLPRAISHIGKLLGQKILDMIDYFVPTPSNFCV
jgi:hypothetical protein